MCIDDFYIFVCVIVECMGDHSLSTHVMKFNLVLLFFDIRVNGCSQIQS